MPMRSVSTLALALACAAAATLAPGCVRPTFPDGGGSDSGLPVCSNGVDDDGDVLTDFPNDPGCVDGADEDETDPPDCGNGVDDDGDGVADFPMDPGCTSDTDPDETNPECFDGIDNDGDGDVDWPDDADCLSQGDLREAPDPACSNGLDDNGNGLIDFPNDLGCTDANDDTESGAPDCAGGIPVAEITYTGYLAGTTEGTSVTSGTCGGADAPESYAWLNVPVQLMTLNITSFGTIFANVLYVETTCADPLSSVGCATAAVDPTTGAVTAPAYLEMSNVAPGGYFIGVDGLTATAMGQFYLRVYGIIAGGQPCTPGDEVFRCDTSLGFDCVEPLPGTGTVCVAGLCSDGFDNDVDGITDWPLDPGCDDVLDNDEADPPTVPECYDGTDNDADALTDYPADPGCEDTADGLELDQCVPGLLVNNLPPTGNVLGTTSGTSFLDFMCDASFMGSGPDAAWLLTVPSIATVTVSTANGGTTFNTNLSVRDECDVASTELACASTFALGETLVLPDLLPGSYFVLVDGQDLAAGSYELSVSGAIASGQPCDPAWTRFACEVTTACEPGAGPTGMICTLADCADGADNDGDGDVDFPFDPGCVDLSDGSEIDSCPAAASCPECANGADDDGDSTIDYPSDLGCGAAADDDEQGCLWDFSSGAIPTGWTVTDTCGSGVDWQAYSGQSYSPSYALWYGNAATNNFDCGGATHSGSATTGTINLPAAGSSLTFWTWGESEGCSAPSGGYDRLELDVDPIGAAGAVEVWSRCADTATSGGTLGAWVMRTVDLSAYNGMSVQLVWRFDTVDGIGNAGAGWYVDDMFVNGGCP